MWCPIKYIWLCSICWQGKHNQWITSIAEYVCPWCDGSVFGIYYWVKVSFLMAYSKGTDLIENAIKWVYWIGRENPSSYAAIFTKYHPMRTRDPAIMAHYMQCHFHKCPCHDDLSPTLDKSQHQVESLPYSYINFTGFLPQINLMNQWVCGKSNDYGPTDGATV